MERKVNALGFVNVDKPSGMTSSAVVNRVKWLTGLPCGHMGTLDPLASGVLPVGVGNATRLFDWFLDKEKEYVAEFVFGVTSDTLDTTGELMPCGGVPSEGAVAAALPRFVGEIDQVPPRYSAKNVNGRRGYDLARAGVSFELPPKRVKVYAFDLLGRSEEREDAFRFRIRCGGGTYIRSFARDLGAALGTGGVMSALRRTQSGCFLIGDAVPFALLNEENIEKYILPTENTLPFPELSFSENDRIFNGIPARTAVPDGKYKAFRGGAFYGIAEVKGGRAKIATKLC